MDRAVVLLDGGYLAKLLKDEFGEPRIDHLKLSENLSNGYERLRTYYYDCMPYQDDPPTQLQSKMFSDKSRFIRKLESLPRFDVRLGKLRLRDGEYVQKRTDILLAIDLVRLASKGQIQKATLLAGDADYVPAVEVAKNDGVVVHLYHSQVIGKYSNELHQACDERTPITGGLIDSCKLAPRSEVLDVGNIRSAHP